MLIIQNLKGPSTQQIGTWVLRNSDFSAGFGKYITISYLDPRGLGFRV